MSLVAMQDARYRTLPRTWWYRVPGGDKWVPRGGAGWVGRWYPGWCSTVPSLAQPSLACLACPSLSLSGPDWP